MRSKAWYYDDMVDEVKNQNGDVTHDIQNLPGVKNISEPLESIEAVENLAKKYCEENSWKTQYCNDPVKEITPEERVVKSLVKWNPGKNIIQVQFKRIQYDGYDYTYNFITRDAGRQISHKVLMDIGPNDCLIGYYKYFDLYVFCPFGGE